MKKFVSLTLVLVLIISLVACGDASDDNLDNIADDVVVRTEEVAGEDGIVITHGYNKNDIHISEIATCPDGSTYEHIYDLDGNRIGEIATFADGSVYEHQYDIDGNHISEICNLADGSYHEFQYDKDGNIIKEIHS